MRALWIMTLLAFNLLAARQPASTGFAVVVDFDSPLANPEQATALRSTALAGLESKSDLVFFELTGRSIRRVPQDASASFLGLPFSYEQPKFSGISLSFSEAVEILRKNEAVRDTVIGRSCPSRTNDCGPAVHAAATAFVADTEKATARKLRHLVDAVTTVPAKTFVILTAGWPYRDSNGIDLDRTIERLKEHGVRLQVLRLPAVSPYEGNVKDAIEAVADSVSGQLLQLQNSQDADRARNLIASAIGTIAPQEPSGVVETSAPRTPVADKPRAAFDRTDAVLGRAMSYVGRFTKAFSAVMWHERYEQVARGRRRFNSSGTGFSVITGRRELESELLLVWLPKDSSWIAVRDVIAIDGKRRSETDRHLTTVLRQPSVTTDDLKHLAAENGRFNIGRIVRTFNEPTLGLLFLDERYRHRFGYARSGEEMMNGRRATKYDFAELGSPTIIQNQKRDVQAEGSLWIDSSTGEVLQTSLELSDAVDRLRGRMIVRYGTNSNLDVLVPLEMRETYTSPEGDEISAIATYSNFRRFETSGRIILPQ